MRLLLDANLSPRRIGEPLRKRGHDVVGAVGDSALEALDDESLLHAATRDRRILVTRNSRDFAPICRTWAEADREHAGVILIWSFSHRQYGEIVAGVERWLADVPAPRAWRGLTVSV